MAQLQINGETIRDEAKIREVLSHENIPYERWGIKSGPLGTDTEVLTTYAAEVERLKDQNGYITADCVALDRDTPNLPAILAKFDKVHHHVEDEVRFTVAGSGVFEIQRTNSDEMLKFVAEPGDLIVVPANRRHLFYLTDEQSIRCIRLFKTKEGWEAIY